MKKRDKVERKRKAEASYDSRGWLLPLDKKKQSGWA